MAVGGNVPEPNLSDQPKIEFREQYSEPIRIGVQVFRLTIHSSGTVERIDTRFPLTKELREDIIRTVSQWKIYLSQQVYSYGRLA